MSCSLLQLSVSSGEARSANFLSEVSLSTFKPMGFSEVHVKLGHAPFCEFGSTLSIYDTSRSTGFATR